MKVLKRQKYFSETTGEELGYRMVSDHERCDFSGEVLGGEGQGYDSDSAPFPTYALDYGDMDPCFGSGGVEYEFSQKYDVQMWEFLSDPYTVIHWYEPELLKTATHTFAEALREARVKTAQRLIEEGVITAEQLVGYGDW